MEVDERRRTAKMGRIFREARRRGGLRQTQLAEMTGVPAVVISKIESGETNTSFRTLVALAAGLGLELDLVERRSDRVEEAETGERDSLARETQEVLSRLLSRSAESGQSFSPRIKETATPPELPVGARLTTGSYGGLRIYSALVQKGAQVILVESTGSMDSLRSKVAAALERREG